MRAFIFFALIVGVLLSLAYAEDQQEQLVRTKRQFFGPGFGGYGGYGGYGGFGRPYGFGPGYGGYGHRHHGFGGFGGYGGYGGYGRYGFPGGFYG
ncbi:neuropeptide-like protein 31 [Drosophila albomicans]|uniref:Neuropeptide-like protein 31 n=1 Tax=Drosophila albomicans TaxID=7291 RepID=A0A6P8ZFC9_DROAB|nr:neuropeptide-like protein 31 [Drosophila albomicans]